MTVTHGLGAGAHPEIGMSAAEESGLEIGEHLDGAHMVFITAGMGGGTGTGAAPIIAKSARERGILTVGVVTKPFTFEGRHRMRLAEAGISELQRYVDTLIVIPNQNLFRIANERTTFAEAFGMADQVLHSGVRSITDLMVLPGLINLDFADVRTVMTEMGKAMMGTGEATGDDRALMASQNAIANPLLDEVSLKGAKAVLVNVTGGLDMTLLEVDEAANAISEQVDPEANIIFGAAFDPALDGKIRVSVVATGMDGVSIAAIEPKPARMNTSAQTLRIRDVAPQPQSADEPMPVFARAAESAAASQPSLYSEEIETTPAGDPRRRNRCRRRPIADLRSRPRWPERRTVVAARADANEAPLFAERPLVGDDHQRGHKGGWLSLFGGGRARQESPPPLRDYRGDPTPVLQARRRGWLASPSSPPSRRARNNRIRTRIWKARPSSAGLPISLCCQRLILETFRNRSCVAAVRRNF